MGFACVSCSLLWLRGEEKEWLSGVLAYLCNIHNDSRMPPFQCRLSCDPSSTCDRLDPNTRTCAARRALSRTFSTWDAVTYVVEVGTHVEWEAFAPPPWQESKPSPVVFPSTCYNFNNPSQLNILKMMKQALVMVALVASASAFAPSRCVSKLGASSGF